jgi:hypothetical protein
MQEHLGKKVEMIPEEMLRDASIATKMFEQAMNAIGIPYVALVVMAESSVSDVADVFGHSPHMEGEVRLTWTAEQVAKQTLDKLLVEAGMTREAFGGSFVEPQNEDKKPS